MDYLSPLSLFHCLPENTVWDFCQGSLQWIAFLYICFPEEQQMLFWSCWKKPIVREKMCWEGKKEKVWRGNILNCSDYLLTRRWTPSAAAAGYWRRSAMLEKSIASVALLTLRILQALEGRTQEVKLQLPGRGQGEVHYGIPSCIKPTQVTSDASFF